MPDFLLEIGCEEIPARMIDAAREELSTRVRDLLRRERLGASFDIEAYSTPRRLAVVARGLVAAQADLEEQAQGPSVKVAFKDGQPTPAAVKFAEKIGVAVEQLQKVSTPKGEYVVARVARKGKSAAAILSNSLPAEVQALYWPKNMYWRGKAAERFVRPVRWMVALLDKEVVPLEFGGIRAGNRSRGHRTLGKEISFAEPASYASQLKEAAVLARASERLAFIRAALDSATRKIAGARWREDKPLLETVVNLTEFPSVVLGNFDSEFLALPEEVLVTVMRDHQKYFAVEDSGGKLAPHFLAVLNTDADRDGVIRHGNERVLRARFNDARFFWEADQKHPLRERVEMLKAVTFQKDLGSYHDKTLRVQMLASQICAVLNDPVKTVREGVVHKAALLAKTDLTTELVKEFTELQGIVGGLYARVQQLDPSMQEDTRHAIADAIYDHYKPESMEDAAPRTREGAVLSIADKADSIAGMFALGLVPSGSKDPFALRRQANGIVKTIAEHKLGLSLAAVFHDAIESYQGSEAAKKFKVAGEDVARAIDIFFRERIEFYLREVLGFAYDVVSAVLAAGADDLVDAIARAQAVSRVRPSEDFEAISAAFKRVKNILRQAREKQARISEPVEPRLLNEEAERKLAAAVAQVAPRVKSLSQEKKFVEALTAMAAIRPDVDLFFDKVMVMVEDEALRANRLGLLNSLLKEFSTIADFSEIVTSK